MQKANSTNSIRNVVVVRFSLRVQAWRRRTFFDDRSRHAWFKYRAMLYAHTLGASFAAQTVNPARVYLLMDAGDRALAERYLSDQRFTPVYSVNRDHHQQVAADLEREGLINNIALSRIDSDDIIARDYFEKLNVSILDSLHQGGPSRLMVACKGYRSNLVDLQAMYYHDGPFITCFCDKYAGETPYFDHKTLRDYAHVKNVSAEWMQVIHGTNVANGFQPPNATSLNAFLDGQHGTAVLAKRLIDPVWFSAWAGFQLPSASLFDDAPIHTTGARIRRLWRNLRGKA